MSLAILFLLVPLLLTVTALATRYISRAGREIEFPVLRRWGPLAAGIVATAFSFWTWGSLDAPTAIHDEAAYVLQAKIFATGHWSAPSPPIPEFFQQYHVNLTPRLAPKYWPGHGLFLVPGVVLELPALMPVILTGIAGGLLFYLAQAVAGSAAAILGFLLWLTGPGAAAWRTTYLSVTSSTALWLSGAFFLFRWWEHRRAVDLAWLSLSAAALAITRPLTAVAFALPTLGAVLIGLRRSRTWQHLAPALAAGIAILMVVPLWSHSSTGKWWNPPYLTYRAIPASSGHQEAALLAGDTDSFVPPDFQAFVDSFRPAHEAHSLQRLPRILAERTARTLSDLFAGPPWRLGLILFLALGVLALGPLGRFSLLWPAALLIVHLPRPHFTIWSVYYVETLGFVAVATGAGLCWLFQRIASQERGRVHLACLAALSLALIGNGIVDIPKAKSRLEERRAYFRAFETVLDQLPEDERSVIFVRYGPNHNFHNSLIRNPPDYEAARYWIVYDRGELNRELLALAPNRVPYRFDEASFLLQPLDSGAGPERADAIGDDEAAERQP